MNDKDEDWLSLMANLVQYQKHHFRRVKGPREQRGIHEDDVHTDAEED